MKTVENVRGLWYAYLCISETMSSLERRVIYEKTGIGAIERAVGINSYNAPFFPNCGTKMDLED